MSSVGLKVAVARAVYYLICPTLRFSSEQGSEALQSLREQSSAAIISFWHSRILGCTRYIQLEVHKKGCAVNVIVSRSEDGEIISRLIESQGGRTTRGSSSRGGSRALRTMVRFLREESGVAVTTPDGPRGPSRHFQPGTVLLSQLSGVPIYPMSFAAERSWRLRSWDRFILPRPFSRVAMVVGEPITVPAKLDEAGREAKRVEIEAALRRADRRAAEVFGVPE